MNRALFVLGLLLCCTLPLRAQLAITEVMSQAGLESDPGYSRPDFWELTNFGDDDIPLDGYSFSDSRRTDLLVDYPFTDLVIHPGESIIFFRAEEYRSSITNAERFKDWWGHTNLPSNLQVRTYVAPGLDGDSHDELWVYDPQLNVVDAVFFGEARIGRSFTVDRDSGIFGVYSISNVNGAFHSALGEDIASPGSSVRAVEIRVTIPPEDATVDFGADASFSVVAVGLPHPRFQWYDNTQPIPGATSPTLTISNVTCADARTNTIWVQIENGIHSASTVPVSLFVNTNLTPPVILSPPVNISVFSNQTAVFSVSARGYPLPLYQWSSNSIPIPGATFRTLTLSAAKPIMSGTVYSVRIWNSQGQTNLAASLKVTRRPLLRFTEIMANPIFSDSNAHYDWFELTNFDTNTIDLLGYRFFDTPTFMGAFTITSPLFIKPGESIVFVEHMTPEQFWWWWGYDNYSPEIQVVTYNGFSLLYTGEQLFLWNPGSTDPYDIVADTSWALASPGISLQCESLGCDEEYGCIGSCLEDTILGQHGSWHAQVQGDVGSPGYTNNPSFRILSITNKISSVELRCRVVSGKSYRLYRATSLVPVGWEMVADFPAQSTILLIEEAKRSGENTLFLRLEELP